MFKKLFAALLAFVAISASAVDANTGSQAELEVVKGIGPIMSTLILSERKKSPFKDWNDLVVRIKGIGEVNAAKFSTGGLTVNGTAFAGAPAAVKSTTAAAASARGPVGKAADATENGVKKAATATASGVRKAASATANGVEKAAVATKTKAGEMKDGAIAKTDTAVDSAKEAKSDRAAKRAAKRAEKAASAAK